MAFQIIETLLRPWLCCLVAQALLRLFTGIWALLFCLPIWPAPAPAPQAAKSFPDTDPLIQRVEQNQKNLESLVDAYTLTDTQTISTLDKNGKIRSQHIDKYYLTPTPYETFSIHVTHDGKPVSDSDLKKQQDQIERKLREYEKKSEKPGGVRQRKYFLFADIVANSRFTPLRWDQFAGKPVVVYTFEPKTPPHHKTGDLGTRIAEDLKGTMWIAPDDAEILRADFSNVAPLTFGYGFLGNAKSFQGYIEQSRIHNEAWLPLHQEFTAEGRQLVSGFRMRQVDDFSEYLKATTDVFQQIHPPKESGSDTTSTTAAPK
jgi:hypothetical protein